MTTALNWLLLLKVNIGKPAVQAAHKQIIPNRMSTSIMKSDPVNTEISSVELSCQCKQVFSLICRECSILILNR